MPRHENGPVGKLECPACGHIWESSAKRRSKVRCPSCTEYHAVTVKEAGIAQRVFVNARDDEASYRRDKRVRVTEDTPFESWDGEGCQDTGYSHFGNSSGTARITQPNIPTRTIFDTMLYDELKHPRRFNVGYALEYDVNMWLKDVSYLSLNWLRRLNSCRWEGYTITHIPNKWFQVSRRMYVCDKCSEFMLKQSDTSYECPKCYYWHDTTTPVTRTIKCHCGHKAEYTGSPGSEVLCGGCGSKKYITDVFFRNIRFKIFDVFSFFVAPYCMGNEINYGRKGALDAWKIGTQEQRNSIARGKDKRETFMWADIDEIVEYWTEELSLMTDLMNALRTALNDAGYHGIRSWHGPGALARIALKRWLTAGAMSVKNEIPMPDQVFIAALYAYTGGHFEQYLCGYYNGKIYHTDVRSAYPYAATKLPDLAHGHWKHRSAHEIDRTLIDPDDFVLYQIDYHTALKGDEKLRNMYPLFQRDANDNPRWVPDVTGGWYFSPEAFLVRDDPDAVFCEAWIYVPDDPSTHPFSWLYDEYHHRITLKCPHNPKCHGTCPDYNASEKAVNLVLRSAYGQLAQRTGWIENPKKSAERFRDLNRNAKQHAPAFHELLWAGYITSYCKMMVYRAAKPLFDRGSLITVDTDGLFSTEPPESYDSDLQGKYISGPPNPDLTTRYGDDLGDWELTEHDGILAWQSSIYWLKDEGVWGREYRMRGASRKELSFADVFNALRNWERKPRQSKRPGGLVVLHRVLNPVVHGKRKMFYKYSACLSRRNMGIWREWRQEEYDLEMGGSLDGKRYHDAERCQTCKDDIILGLHETLKARTIIYDRDQATPISPNESHPHKLPWLDKNYKKKRKDKLDSEDILFGEDY